MTESPIKEPADTQSANQQSSSADKQEQAFTAEVSRLLYMMVHSVYSNKDVFLRELISNAADACEKLRHLSLIDDSLSVGEEPFRITLITDKDHHTLTILDNGIGMSRDELADNLGTIARSGTRAFLDDLTQTPDGQDGAALIGQFGVGFYSVFMVADSVTVTSRHIGAEEAWRWTSDGKGTFSIEAAELSEAPKRGTEIRIQLSKEAQSYSEVNTIERIVRDTSAHVPIPIDLKENASAEAKEIGDGSALWRKSKNDVTSEQYTEFYRSSGMAFDEPATTIHYRAEGRYEYSVLLFIPSMKPFDLFDPERKGHVRLYVRRVFITDEAQILPPWLRFVRGVVDSEDLPLNISREMLQNNPVLAQIRKGLAKRILSDLSKLADKDTETYEKVWDAFGPVLKEGLYEDPERRDDLFKLVRFRSTTGKDWRSLDQYIADLKENQTSIYYMLAEDLDRATASPHLEGYRARGIEVLLLTDPVDTFWVRTAIGYDGKSFKSITQGEADLDQIVKEDGQDPSVDEAPHDAEDIAKLITFIKETLGESVSDVRTSKRLADSAVCLVASDTAPDRQFERLMARQDGQGGAMAAPVLEINAGHAMIKAVSAHLSTDPNAADTAWLLLDQARILDGEIPTEPRSFSERLTRLMMRLSNQ